MSGHISLVASLNQSGALANPAIRSAFTRVDRGLFVPDRIWPMDAGEEESISRADSPGAWRAQVYADVPVITQMINGDYTSSASMPSIVAAMLAELDLFPGQRVLEAGTGTGYNAALLATIAGAPNVTTVEADPGIAEHAHKALECAGFGQVHVTRGDASAGYERNAPYDRIISTYAVPAVPYPWVEQARPGGVIVTPWGTPFDNSGLVRLVVDDRGQAYGKFVGSVAFMWDRNHASDLGRFGDTVSEGDQPKNFVTELDPRLVLDEHAAFTIGLHVPSCYPDTVPDPDGSGAFTLWVLAVDRGSWAAATYDPDFTTDWHVQQHGRRRLWDEIENAYGRWLDAGKPRREQYRLTVTLAGQSVYLERR